MSDVWVQPTGGALGADIHGVDLSRPVGDAAFQRILQAWSNHLVLRFSGQKIEDDMLMVRLDRHRRATPSPADVRIPVRA